MADGARMTIVLDSGGRTDLVRCKSEASLCDGCRERFGER